MNFYIIFLFIVSKYFEFCHSQTICASFGYVTNEGNEALQLQFNLFVLKNEQEEYTREGKLRDNLSSFWKK